MSIIVRESTLRFKFLYRGLTMEGSSIIKKFTQYRLLQDGQHRGLNSHEESYKDLIIERSSVINNNNNNNNN